MASGSLHRYWTHQPERFGSLREGAITCHSSLLQWIESDNYQRIDCRHGNTTLSNVLQTNGVCKHSARHSVVKLRRKGFKGTGRCNQFNTQNFRSILFLNHQEMCHALDNIASQQLIGIFFCWNSDASRVITAPRSTRYLGGNPPLQPWTTTVTSMLLQQYTQRHLLVLERQPSTGPKATAAVESFRQAHSPPRVLGTKFCHDYHRVVEWQRSSPSRRRHRGVNDERHSCASTYSVAVLRLPEDHDACQKITTRRTYWDGVQPAAPSGQKLPPHGCGVCPKLKPGSWQNAYIGL